MKYRRLGANGPEVSAISMGRGAPGIGVFGLGRGDEGDDGKTAAEQLALPMALFLASRSLAGS